MREGTSAQGFHQCFVDLIYTGQYKTTCIAHQFTKEISTKPEPLLCQKEKSNYSKAEEFCSIKCL